MRNLLSLLRMLIIVIMIIALVYAVQDFIRSCTKEPETIKEGKIIQRTPYWTEIKPKMVSDIDENKLPSDMASEEIKRLRKQVEWYANYTVQLEEQIMEGSAEIEKEGEDITLSFHGTGDWGLYYGEAGVREGIGWHSMMLQFSPIPLRVYKLRNGTVHITTPADWVEIGNVEVVEEIEHKPWYKEVYLEIGGGVRWGNNISPAIMVGGGYSRYGVELTHTGDDDIMMVKMRLW